MYSLIIWNEHQKEHFRPAVKLFWTEEEAVDTLKEIYEADYNDLIAQGYEIDKTKSYQDEDSAAIYYRSGKVKFSYTYVIVVAEEI